MKYTLNNGWEVKKQENGTGLLHVTPLPNSIFKKEQFIIISEATMKAIEKGERNIHILFKKYNLHKQIIQWKKETYSKKSRINTPTKFYGKDFIVTQEGDKYFLEYQLARHGGGSRKFEISKEIYEDARKGDKSLSELFEKYNLYRFDVPENDVK
jgi:hypothetical protein